MALTVRPATFWIDVVIEFFFHFRNNTPLIIAAWKGLPDICGMLVQNGADVNAKNNT